MFGSTRPTLFGNNANSSFGSSGITFGGAAATPFGGTANNTAFGTSSFGSQPAAGGLFGNATNTTPGGSLFGGGTTSVFGQNAQPQQQQQSAFSFGNTAVSTAQPATAGGGLFGGTSAFGTAPQTSLFGAGQPSAFGAAAPAASTGGAGLFGATTGFIGGGTAGSGTTVKFVPVIGSDVVMKGGSQQTVQTKLQCITGMKEYENKSLEELRVEDYLANRKGPQQQPAGAFSFGSAATTQQSAFGAFGQQAKPATGVFGGGFAAAPISSTGSTLFSQSQVPQQSGGLFGNTSAFGAAKPLFGTATTTAASNMFGGLSTASAGTSLFGQNQNKSLFGATNTTQASGGLFGSTQPAAATPAFGTGTFGASTAFGNTSAQPAGGLFGAKPAAFGQPTTGIFGQTSAAPNSAFGFGQPQQQQQPTLGGSLFGNKPATSTAGFGGFGTGTSGGFGFGGTPAVTASTGFGTNSLGFGNTSTSLFGQNKLGGGTTSSFGNFGTTGGLSFVNTGLAGQPTLGAGLTSLAPSLGGTIGQPAVDATAMAIAQQNQQQLLQLASSPYGDSPLFRNLRHDAAKREDLLKPTSPAAQKAALSNGTQLKVGIRPMARIKPKPLQTLIGNGKGQLFDGFEEDESSFEGDTFVPRRSVRKLVINSNRPTTSTRSHSPPSVLSAEDAAERRADVRNGDLMVRNGKDFSTLSNNVRVSETERPYGRASDGPLNNTVGELNARNRYSGGLFDMSADNSVIASRDITADGHHRAEDSSSEPDDQSSCLSDTEQSPHPSGIVLRRHGYYTLPSFEEIQRDENGTWLVENFVVGRVGYGNVMFYGATDIEGLNLDEIVHFRRKEITIYPNDEVKPPVGRGLNRKAQVTLDCVWPYDKTTGKVIKSCDRLEKMNYCLKLENSALKMGARFLDYRPETGSWVFEVDHFSKYGLLDDSDDDEISVSDQQFAQLKQLQLLQQQRELLKQQEQQKQGDISNAGSLQLEKHSMEQLDDEFEPTKRGLGGRSMLPDDEEDADMPDITREKFPNGIAGDDGEEQYDVEMMDLVPASHNLARTFGVSASQVQIQKASFFAMEDEFDDMGGKKQGSIPRGFGLGNQLFQTRPSEASVKGVGGSPWNLMVSSFRPETASDSTDKLHAAKRSSTAMNVSQSAFRRETVENTTSRIPSQHHMLIPSGLKEDRPVLKTVIGNRVHRSVVPLEKSLMAGKNSLLMDTGLFHSRRFRIGWAPCSVICHLTPPSLGDKDESSFMETNYSILMDSRSILVAKKSLMQTDYQLTVSAVSASDFASTKNVSSRAVIFERRLRVELQNSENQSKDKCPIYSPKTGTKLLQDYAEQALGEDIESDSLVTASAIWELCLALWGDLDGHTSVSASNDQFEESYVCQLARREALSRWLSTRAAEFVKGEVLTSANKDQSEAAGVFSYMTGRMIDEACRLSISNGDLHLALLVSQAIGSDESRQLMRRQLGAWSQTAMDQFIDHDRLRVLALLAGILVWECSDGQPINTCALLDWKRCFAIHLWYQCVPMATIAEALAAYDKSYKGESIHGKYAVPPLPNYLESSDNGEIDTLDVCYHLLKLYCDRTQPLNVLLNPSSITDNQLDYSLSWHLMEVLLSLGYTNLSDSHHALICVSYASQLESLGLWHWAVFVLCHLPNYDRRENAVKQLLMRHVSLGGALELEKENFLMESVKIPAEWIHEAKAVRAKAEGDHLAEAWHHLKAKNWNKAHSLIVEFIAPDAVVNDNCGAMCECYLTPMSQLTQPSEIKDWLIGGGLFLDYCEMNHCFEQVEQLGDTVSDYDLESLHALASSVGTRLSRFECRKTVDTVCQSMMSKNVAKVMTALLTVKNKASVNQLGNTASHLTSLSLPENDRREFLDHISHALLRNVTSSS